MPRPPIERGAGKGKILFFDAFSGVAGDMTIAALVDLGVPFEIVREGLAALPLDGYELVLEHANRSSIVATRFDVRVKAPQPARTYATIDAMVAGADLPGGAKALARAIFRRLGEAEAAMHRMPLEEVHFHEVGAVDAIVDICGAALALDHLGARSVVSPLPMGRGFVRAQHGILPLPAPATVQCLAGVPTHGVDLDVELVTPTGAAIVATLAEDFARWPTMVPERVGFGAGTRVLPDRPNLLRVVLGEAYAQADAESHVVIEANVDDITGELAGHALTALFEAGALDAWATAAVGKKGRPSLVIAALAPVAARQAVADALLRETTSIGVRFRPVSRLERPRRIVEVETRYGAVPIKVSEGAAGGAPQVKPEFDRCVELAKAHGVPVREVIVAALRAWQPSE